jgi:hypothetical protein
MGKKRPDIGIPRIGLPVYGGKETGQFGFVYVGDQLVFDPDIYNRYRLKNKSVCRERGGLNVEKSALNENNRGF